MSEHAKDAIALILLWLAAPPATLYPIVFGFTTRWRGTLMGRPMLEATIGLAMLIDLSLAYRIFGADYQARDGLRLIAFAVITFAVYDKSFQLARQKYREWLQRRRTN